MSHRVPLCLEIGLRISFSRMQRTFCSIEKKNIDNACTHLSDLTVSQMHAA